MMFGGKISLNVYVSISGIFFLASNKTFLESILNFYWEYETWGRCYQLKITSTTPNAARRRGKDFIVDLKLNSH